MHTLTCCTRMFLRTARSLRTLHIFMRVTHTWLKVVKGVLHAHVVSLLNLTISLLTFHPSSLHGHFETNLTDAPVHTILPNFADLKARVKRTPHEDKQSGCLAKSVFFTGYEPKEFDKITFVDDDTTLMNDPDHNISDFSKTTCENSRQFGVSVKGMNPAPHIHEHLRYTIMATALRTPSRITTSRLSTLR